MKKRRFGIQNHETHFIFHFLTFKLFILNERKLKEKIKLDKWYPKIFGFYIFRDLEKFKNSVISEKHSIQSLKDWINYIYIRKKYDCWCKDEFKKNPRYKCSCGKPNEIIKVECDNCLFHNRT